MSRPEKNSDRKRKAGKSNLMSNKVTHGLPELERLVRLKGASPVRMPTLRSGDDLPKSENDKPS